MNRKQITVGVLGFGVAGALVGGIATATAVDNPARPDAGSARLAASTVPMPCRDDDDVPGRHGGAFGNGTAFEAAAKYLGLTETQLRTQLTDGKTLADVARAQGKTVTGLKDAIVAAVRERLQANTRLTTEQRTAMLERLGTRVDAMVNAKHEPSSGTGLRLGRADDTGNRGPGASMGRGMRAGMGGGMGRMGW
jgi:hypothetical protein